MSEATDEYSHTLSRVLLPQLKNGNQTAFPEIHRRLEAWVRRTAERIVRQHGLPDPLHDAEDLELSAWSRLAEKRTSDLDNVSSADQLRGRMYNWILWSLQRIRRRNSAKMRGGGRIVGLDDLCPTDDRSGTPEVDDDRRMRRVHSRSEWPRDSTESSSDAQHPPASAADGLKQYDPEPESNSGELLQATEFDLTIRELLDAVTDESETRSIVEMLLAGCTRGEIAHQLGMHRNTVAARIRMAVEPVVRRFTDQLSEAP